jgi:DNA invertase Pin-like site-specific DNA recombinase
MAQRVKNRSEAAIGYVRVSTDGQAESGAGLAAQRSAIRSECQRRGWDLAAVYEDAGESAKSLNRPQLAQALEALARGDASVLVVGKLDRLSRSVADFASLVRVAERQGWAILATDLGVDMTSPTGGLLANVTASVAEWERKIISVRTKEALAAKKAQGVKLGKPRMVDVRVADRIRAERAAGRTLQAIADGLNGEGISTPTGRQWTHATVRKVSLQEAVRA